MAAPPDPARRSARARRSILDATTALTAEVGYAAVTVEAIAARAGVGKQTIYRWWPSKGAVLFDAILDRGSDAERGTALPDTGDLRADLQAVLRAVVAELADPATDRTNRAVTAEIQADESLAGELVTRLLRPQMEATADRLDRARQVGQLAPDADVEVAVELLFGPPFHRWLLRTGPLEDEYADRLVAGVLSGLAPRAP
ncbi:TetR/AcrR family transcriptional regulator [Patulibacter sp.]|uniref:TetR/AcrR family transcriptional regulator n=1 Tax=Patulibacter sp. TaxID=1912859 RepID=UPI002716821C|nr:TetR/AcrR family transcriptional regulator [Patulibacter sp.]MDO9410405.1 TetR/AcrR family transcriptional regulator [Patulibacter sp.]